MQEKPSPHSMPSSLWVSWRGVFNPFENPIKYTSTQPMRTKRNLPEPQNLFVCKTCNMEEGISPKEMTSHLQSVHGIKESKGKRSMLMHLDYSDRFAWSYSWKFGEKDEVEAVQTTVTMRSPEDAAYWGEE